MNKLMDQTETKLLSQIVDEFKHVCKYFFSKEDNCIYFIFEDILHAYTIVGGLDAGNINFIWTEEDTEYYIDIDKKTKKERLNKKLTTNYSVLDYEDLVSLYSRLNAERHLNNKKEL